MKKGKIILLAFSFIALFSVSECKAENNFNSDSARVEYVSKIDTSFVVEHPNAKDSLMLTTVVNGVKSVISIYNPNAGNIVDIVAPTTGIVAFICAVWRRFEKRRLRRKGILKDGK